MRRHWHTYKPVANRAEALAFLKLQGWRYSTVKDPGLIVLGEAAWYQANKLIYFVEKGLEAFFLNLSAKFSLNDLGIPLYETISIAWHPDTKLRPVLVTKLVDMVMIHMSSEPGEPTGTYSAYLPSYEPFQKTEELSPLNNDLMARVFGFYVYRHAHPEMISDGFPEDMKERCTRILQRGLVGARVLSATDKIRQSPLCPLAFWSLPRATP